MATTHVFIVDLTTFKYHLEYLFAGTGAGNTVIDFNNSQETSLHHTTENNLVGMIADASRIRQGDNIIFYLQQNFSQEVYEGKFYGIFKAKKNWSFLDNNDDIQFLKNNLNKSLTFRTLIDHFQVYPIGVSEWEALDEIRYIQSPHQMLWSLIYRKLKGKRGNTMITIYEAERLCQLIRNKNNRESIEIDNKKLSFDAENETIILLNENSNYYSGRQEEINILPRLINKERNNQAFESHLQAYIIKNIGLGINENLDQLLIGSGSLEWIGNEVSCGVGMQRIDITLSVEFNEQKRCIPIELKAVEASIGVTNQIQRYVDWIMQYYIPNRISDIQPALIAKKIQDKNSDYYSKLIDNFREFNSNNNTIMDLKYIEFEVLDNNINFRGIDY